MPVEFTLPNRLVGVAAEDAQGPGLVSVIPTESLTSHDGTTLAWRLEELHRCLFSFIPGLPPPSFIDNLLVIIQPDLRATAYVNELKERATVRVRRTVKAGEPVLVDDVEDMTSLDFGVTIPDDAAFVLVRSFGWRKALFFDFGPLNLASPRRNYDVKEVIAKTALNLFQRPLSERTKDVPPRQNANAVIAGEGVAMLTRLLSQNCDQECEYQQFLEAHPWIFGGAYRELRHHPKLDDENIPDFTGIRRHDDCHDIIEIKQPFLPCFRDSGGFSASFNDAWNQAERYLVFAREQRNYLQRQKGLMFENPRCLLVMGYRFTAEQLRQIRAKETCNLAITVISYDRIMAIAQGIIELLRQPFDEMVQPGAPLP